MEEWSKGRRHRAESIGHRAAKGKVDIAKKPRVTLAGLDTDAAGLVRRRERSRTVLTTSYGNLIWLAQPSKKRTFKLKFT